MEPNEDEDDNGNTQPNSPNPKQAATAFSRMRNDSMYFSDLYSDADNDYDDDDIHYDDNNAGTIGKLQQRTTSIRIETTKYYIYKYILLLPIEITTSVSACFVSICNRSAHTQIDEVSKHLFTWQYHIRKSTGIAPSGASEVIMKMLTSTKKLRENRRVVTRSKL